MTDHRQTHARKTEARTEAKDDDSAGFDVWLPLLAALVAAIVLLLPVKAAETAAPRAIYSADRFVMNDAERTMLEEQAARAARASEDLAMASRRLDRLNDQVEMRALPEIRVVRAETVPAPRPMAMPTATRPAYIAQQDMPPPGPGLDRLALALVIAMLLGGALVMLDRTWKRMGPEMPAGQPAV